MFRYPSGHRCLTRRAKPPGLRQRALGVGGLRKLRIGKAIDLELEADDRATAQSQLELLSDRLFANPVIENWSLELLEDGGERPA